MTQVKSSKNNVKELFSKIQRKSRVKECFCNNNECSGDIIKAHSIQNNRILKQLAEYGYILQLKPLFEDDCLFDVEKIGRKIATISTNFCQFHDTNIFKPIEIKDYKKHDKEQEFLFAYRAFAREYHVKLESKNSYENLKQFPEVKDKNYLAHLDLDLSLIGTNKALEEIEEEKLEFNKALNKSDFKIVKTYVIEFYGFYGMAVSSCFAIEYDLYGNKINDLSNFDEKLKYTFLTIFPQAKKTFILLSFYRQHSNIFSFISNQIMKKSINEQKVIISNLILNHVENLIISPVLWRSFIPDQQNKIKQMMLRTVYTLDNHLLNLQDVNLFI